jgi:ABC-type glycerol-3-phosphate transport system substrate-binding protein
MRKKIFSILLCLVLMTGIIAGCSSSGKKVSENGKVSQKPSEDNTPSEGKEKPITITVGMWPAEDDAPGLELNEKRLKEMKEKYPWITIKPDRFPYDVKSFLPKAESGQLPTVYDTYITEPQKIMSGGYAADITDVMKEWGYDKSINKQLLDIVTKDGRYYGLPSYVYTMGLNYNIKMMKEAGLVDEDGKPQIASTWDDVLEFAKKIKDATGQAGFSLPSMNNQGGWQFLNVAWGYGADFEKQGEDGNWTAIFNSPEAVEAMQWVKDLKWEHDVIPANTLLGIDDQDQFFATDQLGMKLRDFGAINGMIQNFGLDKDNVAISRMPGGKAGTFAQLGGGAVMFNPEDTKEEIDAAFKWLEITGFSDKVDEEAMNSFREGLEADAASNKIVGPYGVPEIWPDSERFVAEQKVRKELANVDLSLYEDYLNAGDEITVYPEPPINGQEMYKLIDNVIQAVWTDKNADPKTLLDKAAEDFQRDYLDPYNKTQGGSK